MEVDKLTREAREHEKIHESVAFFTKSLSVFPGSFDNFKQFIDEYIHDHFLFEALELFPVVLAHGTDAEHKLIDELHGDHQDILVLCHQLKTLISDHESDVSGDTYNKAQTLQKNIIESVLVHTQKEESLFFPLLEKYSSHL